MLKIQPIGFSERQMVALRELCPQLGLELCTCAEIKLAAKQADRLTLSKEGDTVTLFYRKPNDLFRALSYLNEFVHDGTPVEESARYDTLCYMVDDSRNSVMTVDATKRLIRYLALAGYDSMMLYTEDTFELPGYPYFGYMRGRYTEAELKEIDDYADLFGIEVIPCIQTLAHLATALRWPDFDGYRDCADILMVGDARTYEFVTAVLRQCRKCFRSKRINLGMDEAHMLGRGEFLQRNGYRDQSEIMLEHLDRVVKICKEFDFAPMIWSDMFFRMAFGKYNVYEGSIPQEVIDKVPPEVTLIYWDYYTMDPALARHMQDCHLQFHNPIAFAGGAWRWSGFGAHNAFSIESTRVQLDECETSGIGTILATAWSIPGSDASHFSVLASALYYAERNYATATIDTELLNRRAMQCFGISFDDLMKFDLPDLLPGQTPQESRHPMGISRYSLFNDPLERLMDAHIQPDTDAVLYAAHAKELFALSEHPTFGYAFDVLAKLCHVLELKCDMGTRLYRAYQANDRDTMKRIACEELPEVLVRLDAFIVAFRRQWHLESKSFGLTAQDYRLGGLKERLASIADRIKDYLDQKTTRIEELEHEPLPFKAGHGGSYLHTYAWISTVIAGRID